MARIEAAAQAAFHNDVGAGRAKMSDSGAASSSSAAAAKKPAPKPSNPYANYSTAQSLGYADPDEERAKAEAERRRTQGVVGDWQYVAPALGAPAEETPANELKRPAETPTDEYDERTFKLRKKTVNLGDVYDPGVITIKPKIKKEETPSPEPPAPTAALQFTSISFKKPSADPLSTTAPLQPASAPSTISADAPQAKSGPKWSKSSWGAPVEEPPVETAAEATVKQELPPVAFTDDAHPPAAEVKQEDTVKEDLASPAAAPSTGGIIFKKRKAGTSAGVSRGGRRF